MKTTYLVFENGVGSALRVASKEEWKRIMEENRNLPRELRRFFVQDCLVLLKAVPLTGFLLVLAPLILHSSLRRLQSSFLFSILPVFSVKG